VELWTSHEKTDRLNDINDILSTDFCIPCGRRRPGKQMNSGRDYGRKNVRLEDRLGPRENVNSVLDEVKEIAQFLLGESRE